LTYNYFKSAAASEKDEIRPDIQVLQVLPARNGQATRDLTPKTRVAFADIPAALPSRAGRSGSVRIPGIR
jgi:hypothetical protein